MNYVNPQWTQQLRLKVTWIHTCLSEEGSDEDSEDENLTKVNVRDIPYCLE